MPQFSVDLCLFDLDGTIVSTTTAAESAWKKLCRQHGVDPVELFKHSHGARSQGMMKKFFPKLDNTCLLYTSGKEFSDKNGHI